MREVMLGAALVGLAVGVAIGRSTERVRRSYRDWGAAKNTSTKAKQVAFGETRKVAIGAVVIVVVLVVIFVGAMNWSG